MPLDCKTAEAEVAEPDEGFDEDENDQTPEASFRMKIKNKISIRVSLPPVVWKWLINGVAAPMVTYWFLFLFHR